MFQDLSPINNAGRAGDFDRARSLALDATKSYPNNAQAWYYLSQADAHLGNIQEATQALARADQLDPTHQFVGNMNAYNALRSKLATVNQTVLVNTKDDYSVTHPGEGSHPFLVGGIILVFVLALAYIIKRLVDNGAAKKLAAEAVREAYSAKNRVDTKLDSYGTRAAAPNPVRATGFQRPAPSQPYIPARPSVTPPAYAAPTPASSTTIINNGSSNDGLVTGLLVGEMLSNNNRHDTYVEHDVEVIHERDPNTGWNPSQSASWNSGSSRSSSYDNGSSSYDSGKSSSSSWDSSPSPSPSWDSGSSSSSSWDSGSSSSWDSGSSSDFSSSSDSSGW
jgi:tetratricopeptide (TPR) repeat protein